MRYPSSATMSSRPYSIVATLCSIVVIAGQSIGTAAGATCKPQERDALLVFKEGISDDPAGRLSSWQGDGEDCCRWRGVRCSNLTGHVLRLNLRNVKGEEAALAGKISPSLLSLPQLKHLDLSMNDLQGGLFFMITGEGDPIPEFLGALKNLRYLNLSGIPFSDEVPPQLGNLSKLHYLDLSGMSHFHPTTEYRMPPTTPHSTDLSWLTRLPFLRFLDLGNVDLSKVLDLPHVVNMIPSLRVLRLSSCSLTWGNQSLPRTNLTNLEELDLSSNDFDNRIESCWFWNLTSLKILNLGAVGLKGQFPAALGYMLSLQALTLSDNELSMETTNLTTLCNLRILRLEAIYSYGHIVELNKSLPQCSSNKLLELYLSGNNFTGVLPSWFGNITTLVILDASYNNISGHLPTFIGRLNNLMNLDLSSNQLTGQVPSAFSMLNNLTRLDLSNNDLDGLITEDNLPGLHSLEYIDLSNNRLKVVFYSPPFRLKEARFASCQMGPLFPAWIQWQVDLTYLDMSSADIDDRLPDWFCNTLAKVTYLDLSNNLLSGELPTNMSMMRLGYVDLSSNHLTGSIPQLPRNLQYVDLSSNHLTGSIPQLPRNLQTLAISQNSLSGPLPSKFGTPNLDTLILFSNNITSLVPQSICELSLYALDLANNHFEGELPQCFQTTNLQFLMLSNNSFTGKFPSFLQNFTILSFLDLSWNRFSGILPMWIGNCSSSLEFLRLNNNMFYGHIPESIVNGTGELRHLNLAFNQFSGVVPRFLSNLAGMEGKYSIEINEPPTSMRSYKFILGELSVITKRQRLGYQGISVLDLTTIDFSSNYLSGELPKEISSLEGLLNLNLSWNNLNGHIPDKIGNMQELESLDLSHNNLSGEIPLSLSNLTSLSILDLSYNSLAGRIPSGGQLDTLFEGNPTMYDGNNGLCGPPLQKICPGNNTSKHIDQEKYEHFYEDTMFFFFGLGVGFVVGAWVVFCGLLFMKSWRIAYFRIMDRVYDKVYVFVVVTWCLLARKAAAN